jgi:hypothetical protein
VGVGVDVTRHHDLARDVDYVVGHFRRYRLCYRIDFSVSYTNIEIAIDIVFWVNDTTVL